LDCRIARVQFVFVRRGTPKRHNLTIARQPSNQAVQRTDWPLRVHAVLWAFREPFRADRAEA
jgi:hypothetical protein